jgi:hypothetical protein
MLTMQQKKEAIDGIAKANGGVVTPEAVVEAAKNPRHILHEVFDWNDQTAAHQHRLNAARQLISSIEVIVETDDVTVTAISYIRDIRKGRKEQGYVSVDALGKRKADAKATLSLELERIIGSIERSRLIAGSLGLAPFFETMLQQALAAKIRIGKKAA